MTAEPIPRWWETVTGGMETTMSRRWSPSDAASHYMEDDIVRPLPAAAEVLPRPVEAEEGVKLRV